MLVNLACWWKNLATSWGSASTTDRLLAILAVFITAAFTTAALESVPILSNAPSFIRIPVFVVLMVILTPGFITGLSEAAREHRQRKGHR